MYDRVLELGAYFEAPQSPAPGQCIRESSHVPLHLHVHRTILVGASGSLQGGVRDVLRSSGAYDQYDGQPFLLNPSNLRLLQSSRGPLPQLYVFFCDLFALVDMRGVHSTHLWSQTTSCEPWVQHASGGIECAPRVNSSRGDSWNGITVCQDICVCISSLWAQYNGTIAG